jgi:Cyclic nucleotide-binding domain
MENSSTETTKTIKEAVPQSPIKQHPWVVDPYCNTSSPTESRFLQSYNKVTRPKISLIASDGLDDRDLMLEEEFQETHYSPSPTSDKKDSISRTSVDSRKQERTRRQRFERARQKMLPRSPSLLNQKIEQSNASTTKESSTENSASIYSFNDIHENASPALYVTRYLTSKDKWKSKVHPDGSTNTARSTFDSGFFDAREAWNQPAGDKSNGGSVAFGIVDATKPHLLEEEEPVFNDDWTASVSAEAWSTKTPQPQFDPVSRGSMPAHQTEDKKCDTAIPVQYRSEEKILPLQEERKTVPLSLKSASRISRQLLKLPGIESQPTNKGSLASPARATSIIISPSSRDTERVSRVKSSQLDSQRHHPLITETYDERSKSTATKNSASPARASIRYTNDVPGHIQRTDIDERDCFPSRGICIESTGTAEIEEGTKTPESIETDILNRPQLDEQNVKQVHTPRTLNEESVFPFGDTRRASSGTCNDILDNPLNMYEGSNFPPRYPRKASSGDGSDETDRQVNAAKIDGESQGDVKLSPKNRRRRVSFQGIDVEVRAKSPKERFDDEFDSRHSQSEHSRWDDSSRGVDDSLEDTLYDQDEESVASVKRPKHRSLGQVTKRIAMNVAKQPKKLAETVARQPKKLANGVRTRWTRTNGTGSSNEVLETGHLSPDEYALIDASLEKNFLFRELYEGALHSLILAFEKVVLDKGHEVIRQGEDSEFDHFVYVVAEGECSVTVDGIQVPGPYGTFGPKSIFGELGVLQNTTRDATIYAKTDCVVLFRAAGTAFHNTLSLMPDGFDEKEPVDMRDIDRAISQLSGTKSLHDGEIMRQYQPDRLWLWSQWYGIILQQNLLTTIIAMLVSATVIAIIEFFGEPTWGIGQVPDQEHYIIQHLALINGVWSYTMPLTTFILTFYVNQG